MPDVHFDDHPHDVAMRSWADRQSSAVYQAVGRLKTHQVPGLADRQGDEAHERPKRAVRPLGP